MLQAFDVPNAISSCTRRDRSNTPLQALTSLNEPVFVDCARALAGLAIEHGGDTARDRITCAFRRVLSRRPSEDELADLTTLLTSSRARFERGELDAAKVIGPAAPPLAGVSSATRAAYTVVARVLLNLDETITKQ